NSKSLPRLKESPTRRQQNIWWSLLELLGGKPEQARSTSEKALKQATDVGFKSDILGALQVIGVVACLDENYVQAKRVCEETELVPNPIIFIPLSKWGLSLASCGLGDYDAASLYVEALQRSGLTYQMPLAFLLSLAPQAVILAYEGAKER